MEKRSWYNNILSDDLRKVYFLCKILTPCTCLLIGAVFGLILPVNLVWKGFLFLLGCVWAMLAYIPQKVSERENIPIKVSWSEKGIYYISQSTKEKHIPWEEVTLIKTVGGKYKDYALFHRGRGGKYGIALGEEIGKELKRRWEESLKQKEREVIKK